MPSGWGCGASRLLVRMQNGWAILEAVWQFLRKVNIFLANDLVILLLDIYPKEMKMYAHTKTLYVNMHNNVTYNHQTLEETQMSLNGWMDKKQTNWASLVAQWLRICLPMQGTRVRALVWEDPTCRGAAGPVSHNYWACASGACAPQQERPR